MERRTEFPALELRRADLERQYSMAQQQVNDALYAGKSDAGMLLWIQGIKAELDELRYVLRVLAAPDGKIEISGRAALLIGLVLLAVFLAQLAILLHVGG